MSVEAGYVGNRGTGRVRGRRARRSISTRRRSTAICRASRQISRRPFFNKFGWTQGIDYFCNCANNAYDSLQAKFNKRFAGGYSVKANYTLQRALTHDAQYFETDLPEHQGLYDSDLNYGPAGWDRKHNAVLSLVAELPIGRNRQYLSDISTVVDAIIGGWQFNVNHIMQSGLPFDVTYRDAGADRDTGPNRVDLIGDPSGPETRTQWFNATPIGTLGQRLRPTGARHVRQHGTQFAARPRLLADGCLDVQALPHGGTGASSRSASKPSTSSTTSTLATRTRRLASLAITTPTRGASIRRHSATRIHSGTSSSR